MAIQGVPEQQPPSSQGPEQPILKTPAEIAHLRGQYEATQARVVHSEAVFRAASGGAHPQSSDDMIQNKSSANYHGLMVGQLNAQEAYQQAQADVYASEGVIPGTDAQIINMVDRISSQKVLRLDDPLYSWLEAQIAKGKFLDQLRAESQARITQEQNDRASLDALKQKRQGKSRIKGLYHRIKGTDTQIDRLQRAIEDYDSSNQRRRDYAEILHSLRLIPGQRDTFVRYHEEALERDRQIELAEVRRKLREQMLQQISSAEYPGYAPGPDMPRQPSYIRPESIFPSNERGVALIPANALQQVVRELGSGITGNARLVSITGLGPPPCIERNRLLSST